MRAARILETALYVRDVAEAIEFYQGTMGLEPVGKVSERNAFFRCGEGILLLFKAEETLKPQLTRSCLFCRKPGGDGRLAQPSGKTWRGDRGRVRLAEWRAFNLLP